MAGVGHFMPCLCLDCSIQFVRALCPFQTRHRTLCLYHRHTRCNRFFFSRPVSGSHIVVSQTLDFIALRLLVGLANQYEHPARIDLENNP
jgi:hypothetical protein